MGGYESIENFDKNMLSKELSPGIHFSGYSTAKGANKTQKFPLKNK